MWLWADLLLQTWSRPRKAGALPNSQSPIDAEDWAVIRTACSSELRICWSILLTPAKSFVISLSPQRAGASRRSDPWPADASLVPLYLRLVIQDRVQERIMDLDLAVIGNEAELAKFVHEKADAGACCTDHLRQRLLADMCCDRLWGAVLSEIVPEEGGGARAASRWN